MGLFDELRRVRDAMMPDRIDDPVRGFAQVAGASGAPHAATSGTLSMRLVVTAEGIAPYQAEHHCICRTDRWPHPGQTLPVEVDRDNPQALRVLWDEVPTGSDRAAAQADAMLRAAQGGAGPTGPAVHHVGGATVHVHSTGGGPVDDEAVRAALRAAEAATGMDLDGDGHVGAPAAPATPGDAATGDDTVAQLERLARMRAEGLLSDEEFRAAKARVLGDG